MVQKKEEVEVMEVESKSEPESKPPIKEVREDAQIRQQEDGR